MQQLKDWQLALIIVAMCGVAFVLVFLGLAIPATRPQAILAPDGEHPPIVNVRVFVSLCVCNGSCGMYWLYCICGTEVVHFIFAW